MSVFTEEKINKLIREHEEKSEKAYLEYQNSGMSRYDRLYREHEDWCDTLRVVINAKSHADRDRKMTTEIKSWAAEISRLDSMSDELRNSTINQILSEIKATKYLIEHM